MQITNSLDKFKLQYERYNETKTDLTHIHNYARSLWVRSCDALSDLGRKIRRLGRRAVSPDVAIRRNITTVGRKTLERK